MAKILYLLNFVGNGGTEKYILDLIHIVGPKNCVFIYSEEGPGLPDFKQTNVKMYQVPMNGPFDLRSAKKIKQIIQVEKVDVVHASFLRENYLGVLAKMMGAKCKVLWTYHVNVPMGMGIRNLNKIITSFNDKVITVSQFMFDQLKQRGVSTKKLQLIYNGVKAPPQSFPLRSLREVPVISVIGRLREEKGQVFLIKSLAHLLKSHPNLKWTCHIYGDGPQHDELVLLVKELKLESFVQFKGFCSDKEILFLNSEIIVVPSSNDAFPYVPIEALSYSRVVVGTRIGGIPEIIKDGESGLLVEYGNEEELSSSLSRLLTDQKLVEKLSNGGRKYFDEHFTFDKMIEKTKALYDY